MTVKLKTLMAGPDGVVEAGEIVDLDPEVEDHLIKTQQAEEHAPGPRTKQLGKKPKAKPAAGDAGAPAATVEPQPEKQPDPPPPKPTEQAPPPAQAADAPAKPVAPAKK